MVANNPDVANLKWWEQPRAARKKFYDYRHETAVALARELGLKDIAEIMVAGWNEEECRCRGPGSSLEFQIYGLRRNQGNLRRAENLCHRRGGIEDRARVWFWFNGFTERKYRYNYFAETLEKYLKAMVVGERPGYGDLRFLMPWVVGMRSKRKRQSAQCEEAIGSDSWSRLRLLQDVGALRFTKPLVRDLLSADDEGKVAEQLFREGICLECFTPRETLLHLCSACPNDGKCVRLARLLLEVDGDICRKVDVNGYTPLVYTLFAHCWQGVNQMSARIISRRRGLERILLDNGCDPLHADRFGIHWKALEDQAGEFIRGWNDAQDS